MKKLLFLMIFFVISYAPLYVYASAKMMVDQKGAVVVLNNELREMSEEEKIAVETRKEVPINTSKRYERTSFFYYTPVEEYSEVVVYKDGILRAIEKSGKMYGEEEFAVYVVALIVAIAFMAIVNLLIYKKMYSVAVAVAGVGAGVGVVAGVGSCVFVVAGAGVVAGVGAGVGVVAGVVACACVVAGANMTKVEMQRYKISSVIFYILAITAIFI